jgi:hypothetical protein
MQSINQQGFVMKYDPATALNRYTQLPFLIDILIRKRLTLIDPRNWEDRNDSFLIGEYKQKMQLKAVLGLCFSSHSETSHHWSIYGHGASGVCIEFKKDEFINGLSSFPKIRAKHVDYKTIQELEASRMKVFDYPFIKRIAFIDECEFRIIAESNDSECDYADIPIDLSWIRKITLSPWMPITIFESSERMIRKIPGCNEIEINHSTLLDNEDWKDVIRGSKSRRGRQNTRIWRISAKSKEQ